MGFIVHDHETGIHGEARRESFVVYSDFGREFSMELDWDEMKELKYVIERLEEHHKRMLETRQ